MQVNWGAYSPVSTIDDYGHASLAMFFRGCDMGCWYCQNKHLQKGEMLVNIDYLKDLIKDSSKFVSSVTFSGGEPLLQPHVLKELIEEAKKHKLEVCLYTSGNHPDELRMLAKDIDRCYIDIKLESAMVKVDYLKYLRNLMRCVTICEDNDIGLFLTVIVFDTTQETIDEIEDYRMLYADRYFTIIQGINGDGAVRCTPDELKKAFKNCYIRTKENGVEWNGQTTTH